MRDFRRQPLTLGERNLLFCRYCGMDRETESSIKAHIRVEHRQLLRGSDAEAGEDYESAPTLERRLLAEDALADRFDSFVESLGGVDDFLLECGDA